MVDKVSKETRSKMMSKIKCNSKIERIPKSLKSLNLRAHPKGILGKPDFGNKGKKIALFIDGCFWHGCPEHFKMPKTRTKFWANKISDNVERDRLVTKTLRSQGWLVIRIWEHELREME